MTVALFTHPACLAHEPGAGHPERPERLRAVLAALDRPEFATLRREEATQASLEQLALAHPVDYVAELLAIRPSTDETVRLDADTVMSSGSAEAARRAVGGACAAVDLVLAGHAGSAFVAVRPPGHHAEPRQAMGFCLFGSVAIAALHARRRWNVRRIAIVDFDVHHGNGTQAMLQNDPEMFFASSHQSPCYPGTGTASETGIDRNVVNLPLPPGTGSAVFRQGWRDVILPALGRFDPELLLVSAGFDAHRADPLAQLELEADDFGWITEALLDIADRHCSGRLVSVLEGGYDLEALALSVAAHVRVLMRPRLGQVREGDGGS